MVRAFQHIAVVVFAIVACTCAFALACPAFADEGHDKVASASQMASSKALLLEGMRPIAGDMVKDGTYPIEVESSSPFFKIRGATLTVKDGQMAAAIELDSKSYPLVFMGTGEQAAAAPYSDYIELDGDTWTFTVPVDALDQEIDCAAYSKRRKQWYDRTLVLQAASLPTGALLVDVPAYGDYVQSGDAGSSDSGTSDAGSSGSGTSASADGSAASASAGGSGGAGSVGIGSLLPLFLFEKRKKRRKKKSLRT